MKIINKLFDITFTLWFATGISEIIATEYTVSSLKNIVDGLENITAGLAIIILLNAVFERIKKKNTKPSE